MLFHTTLLITSLILTLVILWLYKLIVAIARKTSKDHLSNQKSASIGYPDQATLSRSSKVSSEVWGGYGHSRPSTMSRTHPAVPGQAAPRGWRGHDHVNGEYHPMPASSKAGDLNTYLSHHSVNPQVVGTGKLNVDRPDRDDRIAFMGGGAYKGVRREARKAASKDLQYHVDAKPWGW